MSGHSARLHGSLLEARPDEVVGSRTGFKFHWNIFEEFVARFEIHFVLIETRGAAAESTDKHAIQALHIPIATQEHETRWVTATCTRVIAQSFDFTQAPESRILVDARAVGILAREGICVGFAMYCLVR